jgi:hypothetical protein
VDEATKHVVTVDAMERRGSAADLTGGYFKIDSTVRAPSVVMADVLAKFPFEVTVVQNEQPVEAFGAHGPHPALCVGIGPGRSDWRLDHPDALGAKHLVEAGRELGVPIPDQELDRPTAVHEITNQVTGHLRDKRSGRMVSHTQDVHLSRREFDHEEHVELLQRDGRSPSMRRLAPPDALRRIAPGEGVLVYGDLPPARLRLRTWYDDPWLRARARHPGGTPR